MLKILGIFLGVLSVLTVFAPFVVVAVFLYFYTRKRMLREKEMQERSTKGLAKFAQRVGWKYSTSGEMFLPYLGDTVKADSMTKVWNILEGIYKDYPVHVFETGREGGEFLACFRLEHEGDLPLVDIRPHMRIRGWTSRTEKTARALQLGPKAPYIEFAGDPSSDEFSKTFRVVSTNEEFARAVCGTDLMEYLLRHRDFGINILGNTVTLYQPRLEFKRGSIYVGNREVITDEHPVLRAAGIEPRLRQLLEVKSLISAHLPARLSPQATGRVERSERRAERLPATREAESKPSIISATALVLANMIPLAGVLYWSWSVANILVLFWLENVVVGLYNIPKMALCKGFLAVDSRRTYLSSAERDAMSKLSRGDFASKAFLIPFFMVHYGGFVTVHGTFLMMFVLSNKAMRESFDFSTIMIALAGLILSHGISFFVNFLGRGEYLHTDIRTLMARPYGRVVVIHIVIIFGGILIMEANNPLWALVLLVILKIGMDLLAHLAERGKLSQEAMMEKQGARLRKRRLQVRRWRARKQAGNASRERGSHMKE